MNKNFYQIKEQREDWAKETLLTDESLVAKGIEEKMLK